MDLTLHLTPLLLPLLLFLLPLQLSADDKFGSYMDLTLQLANTQGLIPAVRTSTARSVLAGAKATLLMALQDEDVGAVLGKKGQTLTQIQQVRLGSGC
jgi:RNA-binding protein Nova